MGLRNHKIMTIYSQFEKLNSQYRFLNRQFHILGTIKKQDYDNSQLDIPGLHDKLKSHYRFLKWQVSHIGNRKSQDCDNMFSLIPSLILIKLTLCSFEILHNHYCENVFSLIPGKGFWNNYFTFWELEITGLWKYI